ncbi:adenosylcobalamin-dependent ribonucleoside-diphosphate reductase [Megasphaera hominis]|jgi:ribonucleoside-diphosphate reductase alpha chain|uniref:Vitamin B12-dependent ribonucleotide reductase n=1 Tax=Megasphaera hominis TaxID=159836 RepID=A0ABR6VFB2_9FIRM|nr:adenosylcobalamin-dependent ribonucleoside-diphosphate reductase [Megasphaera hominis]MBC3535904.1 adenosylcobalamin-dependent ribonucleoside-diphosphate reductase [Megasphaera hominis]
MDEKEWLGEGNQLGMDIWKNKYRDNEETFEDWIGRVSGHDEEVADLLRQQKFLFGGRILANRGLEYEGKKITLSNCYVMTPPEDNIESIFDRAGKLARTYSYGGGCGIDISRLSPKGARINNAAKETSGSISFMTLYSLVTELIGQNGRRGALMISIDCSHPDVLDFIKLKTDLNKVTKANISVRLSNEFMQAVKEHKEFRLHYTRQETGQTIETMVKAADVFHLLAETNWDYAEPGALFWDRICSWNLLANTKEFTFAGVNPCAEEPLPAGGSCLLGSMNLTQFVTHPFTPEAAFDFDEFKSCVTIGVRALNDVLDEGLPLHPLQEQRDSVKKWRQIGLGIMGLGDMLLKLGLTYGSEEAIAFCHELGFTMADTAIAASAMLAKERGAYEMCHVDEIMQTPYFEANTTEKTAELVRQYGLRNSQLLTIAPTGTLSTMLGISGGIEPIYANFYERKTESLHAADVYYKVYTPIVAEYMKKHELTDDSQLPPYFVTALTLPYQKRLAMQGAWQQHIDASISSTVNVPNSFTVEDTEALYMLAYENGCKGVTLFRDGCKRAGILSTHTQEEAAVPIAGEGLARGEIVAIDDDVIGKKRKLVTGCGSLHCMAFFDTETGALLETYLSKGSTGGCNNFMIALSRMISISARAGIDIYTIIDQLNSTGNCPSYSVRRATRGDTSRGSCCPMAVGNVLLDMYNEVQEELHHKTSGTKKAVRVKPAKPRATDKVKAENIFCPQCGEPLVFEGGCNTCKNCGWSKCY